MVYMSVVCIPRLLKQELVWATDKQFQIISNLAKQLTTVNPQNYTGVNFYRSAQYSNSTSKTFVVWWLKSKSAMPLINFHTCNFYKSQSFAKNLNWLNTCERFWICGMSLRN